MLIPNKHNGYSRDGRRLYYMDGGDSQAPAAEQKASTELPEWAKPYAKDILAKGQALTDVNQNPYQTYNQDRIAGFSPMQQQAMQGAQNMTVAPQTAQGSGLAYGAGLGGLGMATSATPQNFQQNVGGYMNPYLQMALAPQLAEANRQYDISGTRQQSAATQAGAFGGSREAIMAAENERNRNTGLSSIIGQGYNTAFGNAQNQYNQSQQQALQGLNVGIQGAGQLGQLGQNQYGQQMGINQLQSQYGGQQQAQMQKGLDTAYQDFTNQQNYPYKQLGFMSDMIRGLPLGQQSTSQMYQAPPSAMQTVSSLGLGAYGINQMMKAEGGTVQSMREGGLGGSVPGGSVMSREYKEGVVDNIPTDRGLQAAVMGAQARGDGETELAARNEMNEDAAIRRGVSGQVPTQFADNMVRAANGGIVAFALGGTPSKSDLISQSLENREEQSPEDYLTNVRTRNEGLSSLYGPDLTAPFAKELAETREQYKSGNLSNFDKGLIALQMAGAAVDPAARGNTAAAFGLVAKVGGQAGAQLMAQNKQANRELLKSQAEMATAQQNRSEGRVRLASEQENQAETRRAAAHEQRRDAASKAAEILSAEKRNEASVAAQMANVNKLSESERKIADYERRLGRKLNPDEYLDAMRQVGEATFGVRNTGQDKGFERAKMINEALMNGPNGSVAMRLANQINALSGKTDEKSVTKRTELETRLETLRTQEAARFPQQKGATAPTGGAQTPPPQAIEALRQNPALRDQFERKYNVRADQYLGG